MQGWLLIHISGALVTSILILLSSASLIKNLRNWYKPLAKYLGIVSLMQIISGTGLLVTSGSTNLLGFCARIGIYLAVIGFIEILLYNRIVNEKVTPSSRFSNISHKS